MFCENTERQQNLCITERSYQIPAGGLGGTPFEDKPRFAGLWNALSGNPFRTVSPRTGLERSASIGQILRKLTYGNPFKPSVMSIRQEKGKPTTKHPAALLRCRFNVFASTPNSVFGKRVSEIRH